MVTIGSSSSRASDRIEEQLRKMIVTMELPPGAMVTEAYLTKTLNCSRTPLREAFQRLCEQYLIESVPKRGIAIAGLSIIDFGNLIEALVLVEGLASRLATERISDSELTRLEKIVAEAEAASDRGDISTVAELDFEFHHLIGQATSNRYLADTIARLTRLATRFAYIAWQRAGNAQESLADHRQILAALKDREPAEVECLIREHTLGAKERIMATL